MKIINKTLLEEFARKPKCEWCGRKTPQGCDPHHLFSRGAGRLDIRQNLVGICRECHTCNHAGKSPTKQELLAMVAKREKTTQEKIQAMVWRLRRDDKVKVWRVDG